MSIECLSWCIKKETNNPTTKLVLFVLSNYADEKKSCYPSEKHLAKIVGVSARSVRRCLVYLSENNLINIEHRSGTSNRYFLRVDTDVQTATKGMDTDDQTVRTTVSANTKVNSKELYTDAFNAFWVLYPRKINKYLSFQKYQKEIKNFKTSEEGETKLKVAASIYGMMMKGSNVEERFIPHCSTWLNQRRYLEYEEEALQAIKNKMKSKNRLAG